MINRKKLITLISLPLFAISLILITINNIKDKNLDTVNCITRMVYTRGSITQHLVLNFIFDLNSSTGTVNIEGTQLQSGSQEGFINRSIQFTYSRIDDSFTLTSKQIRIIKGESLNLDRIHKSFPTFYTELNSQITYTITKQKNSGYLFLIGGTPRFFCEKN